MKMVINSGLAGPVIDHVVLAARDRTSAEDVLADTGLGVGSSRLIPDAGLSNLVVPFGDSSLEIHYPNGEEPVAGAPPYLSAQRKALAAHPDAALVPVAWIVRYEDREWFRRAAEATGYPIPHSQDDEPDLPGYQLGGLGAGFERPWLPALIHWDMGRDSRPSARPAEHRREVVGTLGLEVSGPRQEIIDWCQGEVPDLISHDGQRGLMRVHVHLADESPIILGIDS